MVDLPTFGSPTIPQFKGIFLSLFPSPKFSYFYWNTAALLAADSGTYARSAGMLRLENKDYIVKDSAVRNIRQSG
jgi:ribosome-binding ATPase YchF (GTP1/OBG family)